MKFAQSCWSISSDCMVKLGINTIEYTSEIELDYHFRHFECQNKTLLIKKFHIVK